MTFDFIFDLLLTWPKHAWLAFGTLVRGVIQLAPKYILYGPVWLKCVHCDPAHRFLRPGAENMVRKLLAATLSDLTPMPDEVKQAQEILDKMSHAEKRSKNGCMTNFLKNNADKKVTDSRGSDRAQYLLNFMVHTLRCEDGEKKTVATFVTEKKAATVETIHEWGMEYNSRNHPSYVRSHGTKCNRFIT